MNIIYIYCHYYLSQVVRKTIAKYLTVINEKARNQIKLTYKKKGLKPLDIRMKKTRAIRRKLTK